MLFSSLKSLQTLCFLSVFLVAGVLSGCDSNSSNEEEFPEPELTRFEDLPADPFTSVGPDGRPTGTGNFTLFSLRENMIIANEDSASADWDIAFRGTDILINSGTSGPGNGAAQLLDGLFEEVLEAPTEGWIQDGETGPAIPFGSGTGWYNYNPAAMVVSPFPGRVILIRTADGLYAKMRIISYYQGAPDAPTVDDAARYYTFEFLLQPDGSRSFE